MQVVLLIVGIKIHGNVVIVDIPNSREVIKPRLIAMTKSAISRTFQTTRTYLDQLNPFFRKYAKGIAVSPIKISRTTNRQKYTKPNAVINPVCYFNYLHFDSNSVSCYKDA